MRLLPPGLRRPPAGAPLEGSSLDPFQLIAISFLGAIGLGAVLLWLPVSLAEGTSISLLDALFTATSAMCVTGLAVVDTGAAFSGFGQVVILVLIQVGGLGVLTFGTLLAVATGRRIGLGERLRVQQQVNALDVGGIVSLVRKIATIVVIAEGAGALLLYVRFAALEGPGVGAWQALFHAVSAFNNAGFSLYSDSLVRFVDDPLVNVVMVALIVVGGLGFIVILNLRARWTAEGPRVPLTLHTRMVLTTTAVLVVVPTVALLVFEYHNPATIGQLSVAGKLQASLFAAVTPRTAGFNSIDMAGMLPASLLLTMLLMFIGGSPGSTAGGIKTVTFAVMAVSIWSVLRGRTETVAFRRRLPTETVVRAGAIAFGAVMVGGAAMTVLALTEPHVDFLSLLFEAVSALGTTGLSLGATAEVGAAGKWILIALMYLGRVGILTFALALLRLQQHRGVRYLSEEVVIG